MYKITTKHGLNLNNEFLINYSSTKKTKIVINRNKIIFNFNFKKFEIT